MMGRLNHDQGQLFYSFSLEEAVPETTKAKDTDAPVIRKIAGRRRLAD
jgi:hypothetical protein